MPRPALSPSPPAPDQSCKPVHLRRGAATAMSGVDAERVSQPADAALLSMRAFFTRSKAPESALWARLAWHQAVPMCYGHSPPSSRPCATPRPAHTRHAPLAALALPQRCFACWPTPLYGLERVDLCCHARPDSVTLTPRSHVPPTMTTYAPCQATLAHMHPGTATEYPHCGTPCHNPASQIHVSVSDV